MQKKRGGKSTERNWVKEYNQASAWDKRMMEYEQRYHAEEVDRMEAAAKEREERRAEEQERKKFAYDQLSPEEQATYNRIRQKKARRKLTVFLLIIVPLFIYLYVKLGITGIVVGVIGAFFVLQALAIIMS